jgi:hypothetical protein
MIALRELINGALRSAAHKRDIRADLMYVKSDATALL